MIASVDEAIIALLGANNNEPMNKLKIYFCLLWIAKAKSMKLFSQDELDEAIDRLIKNKLVRVV